MNYSVESDRVIEMMKGWTTQRTAEILLDIVEDDSVSPEKLKMQNGVKYYNVENAEIQAKTFNEVTILKKRVEIPNIPNNRVMHGYYRIAVDQKVGYIGDPQFTTDSTVVDETIQEVLGEEFPDLCNDWEKGATNKGVEYLYPYVDEEGNFDMVIFPATQIVPIYDTRFNKRLVNVIRYYVYTYKDQVKNKATELYKIEVYHKHGIDFWTQNVNKKLEYDRFEPYLSKKRILGEEENLSVNRDGNLESDRDNVEQLTWDDQIPIIELPNNTEKMPDLYLAKTLLDDYDLHKSVFSNDLESVQEALLHIQGYRVTGGTVEEQALEWAKLKETILRLKMILTTGENDKVDAVKQEIPHGAKDSHLDRTRSELWTLLMGVDPQQVGDGNITNIVIKARYLLLDMKSNLMIAKLQKALRRLLFFVAKYVELTPNSAELKLAQFNYKDVKIMIDKNALVNEKEVIENLAKSTDMSAESRLEKHPYVDDVAEELRRKKAELDEISQMFNDENTDLNDNSNNNNDDE